MSSSILLYIFGISITAFLSLLLATKKGKTVADKLLLVWLAIILLHLTIYAVNSSGYYLVFPYLLGFELPMPLLHGPMLFLYTKSLTTAQVSKTVKIKHLLGFGVGWVLISPFMVSSFAHKIAVYQNDGRAYPIINTLLFVAIVSSVLIYCILSLKLLIDHSKTIKTNFSFTERINLLWLRYLIVGLALIGVFILFLDDTYIFTAVVVYVIFIGYFGIKQVGIFTYPPVNEPFILSEKLINSESHAVSEITKYEKTLLDKKQLQEIFAALNFLMEIEKYYLNPELNLATIANKLSVSPNTLSQVINRCTQSSFFDYINNLRIEEFKTKTRSTEIQKYTLLALAMDCGFNSKTAFNRNFKKVTGLSPSEYLNAVKVENSETDYL